VLPGKAAGVLRAGGMTAPILDRAYLRTWGEHMDPAFSRTCSDLGVELESSKEAA
jgi:hypothetical protein